jgi:S-adenosylmethionine synthetase
MGVQVNLVKQSNEIATGVDSGGAGDQGIMVGYACN